MKNIILVCLLILIQILYPKMWINPVSEVRFGPTDISVYGGINVDLTKQTNNTRNKAAGVYFDTASRLCFIGAAEDTITNIIALNNVTLDKAGGSLHLLDNLNIAGNLDFNSGSIATGADTLVLSLATSTITGESGDGFVVGNLKSKRYIGTNNSAATNHFGGIGLRINDTGNDIGTVTVHRKTGDGSQVVINDIEGIKRQFKIETSVPFTGTRSISANWLGAEDNGNMLPILKAWKYIETKSGTWQYIPGANFTIMVDPRTASFTIDRATSFTFNMGPYFAGGRGTISEPWLIRTAQNLDSLRYFIGDVFDNCDFRQIADINLGIAPWNSGEGWEPIGNGMSPFKASYDGNGLSINNLTINRPTMDYVGLFGNISDAYLQNIKLNNAAVEGKDYVGILSGSLLQYNSINNCSVSGAVSGIVCVGGLIGRNLLSSTVIRCSSDGTVLGEYNTGGLIGYSDNSYVYSSFSKSNITGINDSGGFIGYDYKTIINDSYAFGSVSATSNVGGFIGNTYQTSISNCYSIGAVTGTSSKGGFVGRNYSASVIHSYWDKETSGRDSSACGEGRTTDEMTFENDPGAYVGWDFTSPMSIWETNYNINGGYPYLRWQNIPNTNFAGGKGTVDEPYLIETATQLDKVRYYRTKVFRQIANIDLGVAPWNIGEGWVPISTDWMKPFRGSYEGDFYSINNLTIDRDSMVYNYVSLFGVVRSAQIKEIKIINADVKGFYSSGILAGLCDSVSVQDCSVSGEITGAGSVGGLIGSMNTAALLTRCFTDATVTGTADYIGGLIGSGNNNFNIAECYSKGTVTGDDYAGGLAGYDYGSKYYNCYSFANVSADTSFAGGLISYSYSSSFYNCYSKGAVSALSNAGGLIGYNNYSTFSSSYWNTETSGQIISAGGSGRTTDEMTFEQAANTYTGWDFMSASSTWEINYGINSGYPYLRWQNLPNTNFAGGNGSVDEPYLVQTATHLNNVRYYRTKVFRQTADIDLGVSPWNTGNGWNPIGNVWSNSFNGTYDGDYFKISNLTISRSSEMNTGLFGYCENASVKKIKIESADVTGFFQSGILGGFCFSTQIRNCSVSGEISGAGYIGGIAGYFYADSLSQCFSTADVTCTGSDIGGIAGYTSSSNLYNCYSTGSVSGDSYIGGMIGYNNSTNVYACYSTGAVSGNTNLGGLIGYNDTGSIIISFWNTQTSGRSTSSGGTGKTTDDMTYPYEVNTFVNWDFSYTPIWVGNANFNNGYPYLLWENRSATGAPQNLSASIASNEITLTWDAVPGAISYKVYSSEDPYGTFTETTGTFLGPTQWKIALSGTRRFYYVKAVNDAKRVAKKIRNPGIINEE